MTRRATAAPTGDPPPVPPNCVGKNAPPVWKKRLFSSGSFIEAAVFRNEVDNGDSSFTAYSVSLQRSYKDGETWKDTRSLRRDDLLVASHLLQRAYAWIGEQDTASV